MCTGVGGCGNLKTRYFEHMASILLGKRHFTANWLPDFHGLEPHHSRKSV
jgi:hypothetical protein